MVLSRGGELESQSVESSADPSNRSGEPNRTIQVIDKSNSAVGASQASMMETFGQLGKEEIIKTGKKGTIEFVEQFKHVDDIGNSLISKVEGVGVVAGFVDAGVAIHEAYNNPTAGNITKAAVKSVLALVKTNPVVNLVTSIADLTGLTDKVFGLLD